MSDDPMLMTMLEEHERTADNLVKGVNVSNETMQRYHGLNGKLLAQTIRNLWTQQQLEAQIDQRVSARCATCKKTEDAPTTLLGMVAANAKTILVCLTVLGGLACLTGNFDKLVDGVTRMSESHVVTAK